MESIKIFLGRLQAWFALFLLVVAAQSMAATPYRTMTQVPAPTDGIQDIYVGNDLSTQVKHTIDATRLQVFPPGTTPGDFGTFVVVDGALFAPDFENHGNTATSSIGARTVYTPISQSTVQGAGTSASPLVITTDVALATTGLAITQRDSFVNGNEFYTTDVVIKNAGGADKEVVVYRALDCFLGGSDSGYGMKSGDSVACSKNPDNSPADRVIQLIPLTTGSALYQSFYGTVWGVIGTHAMFDNSCACSISQDNGIGLSWKVVVPAGGSTTISNLTLFSPSGKLPVKMAAVANPTAVAAGGQTSYTLTLTNPNQTAVTLNKIEDVLPAGFTYMSGTTSGAVSTDPSVVGSTLTWTTPVTLAASGSLSFTFNASVGITVPAGTYTSAINGSADNGFSVQGDAAAAPVTVTAYGMQPLTVSAVAAPSLVKPGDQTSYTMTVTNPNPLAANLDTLTQELPADFAYLVGTSSGAVAADPAVAGQMLTWAGPIVVPANGTAVVTLKVGVGTAVANGTYPTNVGGTSAVAAVTGATATAPVTVTQTPVTALVVNLGLSAAPSTAPAGGGVGYSVQLSNTSASSITVDTVAVKLPGGFDYVPGSTTGALTSNPVVTRAALMKNASDELRATASPTVSWSGPITVPANGSVSVDFKASIASDVTAGTYTSDVSGAAAGATVNGVIGTAPVTVTVASTSTSPTPVPVDSPWALLLLSGVLVAAMGRRKR